jgi:hypothetical protein
MGLHPAAIVTGCRQALADRFGLLARSGRQKNEAMPNTLSSHIEGFYFAFPPLQEVWKAVLQIRKGAPNGR